MNGQYDLWGNEIVSDEPSNYEEKIQRAKDDLTLAADISEKYYRAPLIITYSGGKDSDVMLHLACECLAPSRFEVLNSHTTVDAPQTVRHIEKVFTGLRARGIITRYSNRYPVKKTMWELICEKEIPPTRFARYCREELKETATPNRICAIGVRESESVNRKGRDVFSSRDDGFKKWSLNHAREVFKDAEVYDEVYDCVMVTKAKENKDLVVNPIYKFNDADVWQYIRENNIEVNPLYAMGYRRVGCILCPLGGRKSMLKGAADFPKYKAAYIKAFDRMLKKRKAKGKDDVTGKDGYHKWETGEDVYDWWVNGTHGIKEQMTFLEKGGD